jgi:DNA-binding MarR family transcriptional regulator
VLSYLSHHASITARELATHIGITERAVRKIINDLETDGYIQKERDGRRVNYSVKKNLPLRHRAHQDKLVGDLLKVLGLVDMASRERAERGEK